MEQPPIITCTVTGPEATPAHIPTTGGIQHIIASPTGEVMVAHLHTVRT